MEELTREATETSSDGLKMENTPNSASSDLDANMANLHPLTSFGAQLINNNLTTNLHQTEPDNVRKVTQESSDEGPSLYTLTTDGMVEELRVMLEGDRDVVKNLEDRGREAVLSAAWNGHVEVVKTLLEAGADLGKAEGKWLARYETAEEKPDMTKVFLDAGVSGNELDSKGWLALPTKAFNLFSAPGAWAAWINEPRIEDLHFSLKAMYHWSPEESRLEGEDWFAIFNDKQDLHIALLHSFQHSGGVYCISISKDGKYICSGGDEGVIIFDINTGVEVASLDDDEADGDGERNSFDNTDEEYEYVNSVCFTPDFRVAIAR